VLLLVNIELHSTAHGAPNKPTAWEMTTFASFIMVPEEGKMYIAKGSPCENDYVEYTV